MKVVLAGFPRVGKTTVFRSLTGLAEGGATTRGGVARGVIRVPDERVDRLVEMYRPRKTTWATVRFVDVQPETTGPAEREGVLSAPLVAEVRDADAVVAVLRDFPDPFTAAPSEPERELVRFDEELVLTDLAVLERRLDRVRREGKKDREPELLERLVAWLGDGKPLRTAAIDDADSRWLQGYQLVSRKPLLVVLNRSDDRAAEVLPEGLVAEARLRGAEVLALAGRIESEIAELPEEEQEAFLRDAGLDASARARFVRTAYGMLDLMSFLTVGEDEVRAWTVSRGTPAARAAGKIHSDIEKGFIRAEVVSYEELLRLGGETECRRAGRMRLEGRDYVVQDGDVVSFRFNV